MTSCNTQFPPQRSLDGLEPDFKQRVEQWLKEVPQITVHETLRSDERQKCLQQNGASKIQRSLHQDGKAVDVHFKQAPHFPEGNDPRWVPVRQAAQKYNIVSGWDLWKWDANHFQDAQKSQKKTPALPSYYDIMIQEVPPKDRLFNVYTPQNTMNETKSLIEIGLYRLQKKHNLL